MSNPHRLHCRELHGERTGVLEFEKSGVELYFVGYDEFVHIREDSPSYVVTEEGYVVSLLENIAGRHSSSSVATRFGGRERGRESDEYRSIIQGGIWSNLAVVGVDAWRPEDSVRRVTFNVAHTDRILAHERKLRSLGSASKPLDDDLILYRANLGGMVLTAGYDVSYGFYTHSLRTHRPTFSIEFRTECSLNALRKRLGDYLSFLSFVLGRRMVPEEVRIDRMSFEDMIRAIKDGTYIREHTVIWNWPPEEHEAKELAFHGAPFLAVDDEELPAFTAGLIAWMERIDEWDAAYASMTESLTLQREISGERLLAAWRWFEEVPSTKAERVLDSAVVEYIIEAAQKGAREKCHGTHIEERIRGSLMKIGEESMRDRFERLVLSLEERFEGDDCLNSMVCHLQNARSFRGRVAHGNFASRNAEELRQFNKATLGMEALCFLLTARDLPLTEEAKKRIWSHPILEAYQRAFD